MKQTGTVYFYNLNSEKGRKIRLLCLKLGLKIRGIEKEQYKEAIGALAGVEGYELTGEVYDGEGFSDEMIVMKGFNNSLLDKFLRGFKSMKIEPVALKAILTEGNINWNSLELYEELVKEHEKMQEYK